jgi:hypothetical protein
MMGNNGRPNGAHVIESMISRYGCIPSIQPMAEIPRFNPRELAELIKHEIARGSEYGLGNGKITIHMDVPDAVALMNFLREKAG